MKNTFTLGLLLALFAVSTPLIADPGGMAVRTHAVSNDYQFIGTTETAALLPAGQVFGATTVSKFIKSAVTLVAGGVVALLGGSLIAMMIAPWMSHLPLFTRRRDRNYDLVSTGLAKRTKSPLLKMRATA